MHHEKFFESGNKLDFSGVDFIEEIEIRNSIGRIYYYIYHEILSWVKSDSQLNNFYQNSTEKSFHKKLRCVFQELANTTKNTIYGKIFRILGLLHQSRCDCDYELQDNINEDFFNTFIANFASLKQTVIILNNNIFKVFKCEIYEEVASTETKNATITVLKKKPSLKCLE